MCPDFRRGGAEIVKAQESSKGNFRPFVPEIKWREDGQERFLLFLNEIDNIPTVSLHTFVPVGAGQKANGEAYTKYESFISRSDAGIGESTDRLTEIGSSPSETCIGVAVELEPIMKTVRGRPRPASFKVATATYDRKTDDGTETVTAPLIGIVAQKPGNFFGYLQSYSQKDGPIEAQAFGITRRGMDKNTTYDFVDFLEQEIDLTGLLDNIDGISYLREYSDDLKTIQGQNASDEEKALSIGDLLLNARLAELADEKRYHELTDSIEEIIPKFGKKDKKDAPKADRPARQSQRAKASDEDGPAPDRNAKFAKIMEKAAAKNAEAAA